MSKISALLQRLLAMLPFRRQPDAESEPDSNGPAGDDATPTQAKSAVTAEADTSADGILPPEDAEADIETAIARARMRLVWKKRIIVAVPTLLLVILIASIAAWLLGSEDEGGQAHEAESATTTAAEDSETKASADHPAPPLAAPAPVDPVDRARELEAQLKQMEQERNALLIEMNALTERNRRLQEAAARRAARSTTPPRSRSALPGSVTQSGDGATDIATPPSSVDCTIGSDPDTAGEVLKRCIEEFNAASEGR